ncbi:ankyrin repeat and MYND domain-containing protein 1-like isoform X2 [Stegastes partitus]|nr:PREDICTED: ankyrin repeat and MYND domain-containing protein 1-like isoform X2 [Stegastes partitus]XP_008297658.1 PREDICTED: ankyrin repeat and MYND domain-containing protein 1-like isoform X2 [Stegastes partitus]XP_008297668.1 PREDICTED: ankyrin repeat and MYND domain-containing protein 1-like isoform X2 [Stegastes partitus]
MKTEEPLSSSKSPHLKEGGRTALHVACQRDSDYVNASKVVALLVSHSACGHSPLSLAIASGNELLEMLAKAGADILMPVTVGDVVGSAGDYAHCSFIQDLRIAKTPFHVLSKREREIFKALLSKMGDLLRQTAGQRERQNLEREQHRTLNTGTRSSERFAHTGGEAKSSNRPLLSHGGLQEKVENRRKPDEGHKEECIRVSGGNQAVSFQQLQPSKPNQHQP